MEQEKIKEIDIIVNEGMFLYSINGNVTVKFFKNKYGNYLKGLYEKLCQPIQKAKQKKAGVRK